MDTEATNNPEVSGGPADARRTSGGTALRLLASGLALLVGLASATAAQLLLEQSGFKQVVSFHVEKYPAMEIEDLYKLAFQAAMGSEHAVESREAASRWLERELSSLTEVPGQPLSEPLSPDGSLVRVNLRALVERGDDTSDLLDAFVRTASDFPGSQERFENYWIAVGSMAEAGKVPFNIGQIQEMWRKMKFQGFPPVHHSTTYRDLYHPAYRVVLLDLLESATPEIPGQ